MQDGVIAAVATALFPAAISVIRVSGEGAVGILDSMFEGKRRLSDLAGFESAFGCLYDRRGDMLDEVVCAVYRAPRSYTGEEMAEISCHGGVKLTQRVLFGLLDRGISLAQPGEFTKRAFLNGKLDLLKADAIADLIYAKTDLALRVAARALSGRMGGRIAALREKAFGLLASIQAAVDFPDEVDEPSAGSIEARLEHLRAEISRIYSSERVGRIIKEGVKTAIVGKPNTGKSTLMNLLSGEEKSIVTPHPGTTRDIVSETVEVEGILLDLADTAGIRMAGDEIESIGVERALGRLLNSDLVIAVFDASEPIDESDLAILHRIKSKNVIGVINKSDLEERLDTTKIYEILPDAVTISAASGEVPAGLKKLIREKTTGGFDFENDDVVTSLRQKEVLSRVLGHIENALGALHGGFSADMIALDLEDAVRAFGELTGETVADEVISAIFARFCVGK